MQTTKNKTKPLDYQQAFLIILVILKYVSPHNTEFCCWDRFQFHNIDGHGVGMYFWTGVQEKGRNFFIFSPHFFLLSGRLFFSPHLLPI